ncbi:hypothetical protein LJC46_08420 [Desulfovibrio sp. OttesenSCG-928-G15]|nr:hypothetical protein [Desulfovibrio sp. OttesenSCG-928-G15]
MSKGFCTVFTQNRRELPVVIECQHTISCACFFFFKELLHPAFLDAHIHKNAYGNNGTKGKDAAEVHITRSPLVACLTSFLNIASIGTLEQAFPSAPCAD